MDGSDVHCIHSGIKSIMEPITPDVVVSSNHPLPVSLYVRFRLSFPCSNYAQLPTCVSGTRTTNLFIRAKPAFFLSNRPPANIYGLNPVNNNMWRGGHQRVHQTKVRKIGELKQRLMDVRERGVGGAMQHSDIDSDVA